jgi:hypothetical protein
MRNGTERREIKSGARGECKTNRSLNNAAGKARPARRDRIGRSVDAQSRMEAGNRGLGRPHLGRPQVSEI